MDDYAPCLEELFMTRIRIMEWRWAWRVWERAHWRADVVSTLKSTTTITLILFPLSPVVLVLVLVLLLLLLVDLSSLSKLEVALIFLHCLVLRENMQNPANRIVIFLVWYFSGSAVCYYVFVCERKMGAGASFSIW